MRCLRLWVPPKNAFKIVQIVTDNKEHVHAVSYTTTATAVVTAAANGNDLVKICTESNSINQK